MAVARFVISICWEAATVDAAVGKGKIGGRGGWDTDVMPVLSGWSKELVSPSRGASATGYAKVQGGLY